MNYVVNCVYIALCRVHYTAMLRIVFFLFFLYVYIIYLGHIFGGACGQSHEFLPTPSVDIQDSNEKEDDWNFSWHDPGETYSDASASTTAVNNHGYQPPTNQQPAAKPIKKRKAKDNEICCLCTLPKKQHKDQSKWVNAAKDIAVQPYLDLPLCRLDEFGNVSNFN